MRNIFKLFLICLLFTSCFTKKQSEFKITKGEKLTFIFDFDATMYNLNKDSAYFDQIYYSIVNCDEQKMKEYKIGTKEIAKKYKEHDFVKELANKYYKNISQKDIDFAVQKVSKNQTSELGNIIKKLKQDGHQVLIIGGSAFGCGIIPDFAKQFGIEKGDIYSGYFKNFSKISLQKAFTFDNFEYVNCENHDIHTVYSKKKSDLIKLLKNQDKIKGKVIHIGDGENDLEVWKAGEVDLFIGFGINRYSKKVEDGSEVYVKTMDGFRKEIDEILGKDNSNIDNTIQITSNSKQGFYSDYFYQISDLATQDKEIYITIIPNNTPGTIIPEDNDDYRTLWNGYAKTWNINSGMSKLLREKLPVVTLAPAFPTQDNSGTYANTLNRKSMNDKRKEWNRQDLQLIEMIKDLKERLKKDGYKVHDKVMFYGFSSQSDFSNRFALLHPQLVKAVAVGGIVDYITLPIAEYNGKKLIYPLGIADLNEIGNHEFNFEEFKKIKFFWYDGEDDINTTFDKRYKVWNEHDIDLIFELFANKKYNENKLYDKKILQNCLKILKENGVNFAYKTYPKVQHNITQEMKDDVVKFFDKILNPQQIQHNLIIYPGRFQPFHQGHYDMIKEAQKHGKHVVIAISQANGMEKDNRNVFSGDEREEMIRGTLEKDGFKNYSIIQLDYVGKDKTLQDWDSNLIKTVKTEYKKIFNKEPAKEDIAFIYYDRDKANYDKRFGKDFDIIEVKSSFEDDISATKIRKEFFEECKIDENLPIGTREFLKRKSQKCNIN